MRTENKDVRDLAVSLRRVYERLQKGSGQLPELLNDDKCFLPKEVSSFGELVTLIEKGPQAIPPAAPEIVVQKVRLWTDYLTSENVIAEGSPLNFPTFEFGAALSTAIAILASNNLLTTPQKLNVIAPLEKGVRFIMSQLAEVTQYDLLSEWWLLAAAVTQTSLAALANITPQAGHVALHVLEVTSKLPAPIANTTDLLEVQLMALSAVRTMLKPGSQTNPLDAPNPKYLHVLFSVSAIRPWERMLGLVFDYEELSFPEQFLVPSQVEAIEKMTQIRCLALAIAGDACASDEQCALALSSRSNESTLIARQSLREVGITGDIDMARAYMEAISEFSLRAAVTDIGLPAGSAHYKLAIESLVQESPEEFQSAYRQLVLHCLFQFLERGEITACRILSHQRIYAWMIDWKFAPDRVLEMISMASQTPGNDGANECAAALSLATPQTSGGFLSQIIKCATSMLLCTTPEGSMKLLGEQKALDRACELALMLAERSVAEFDHVFVDTLKESFLLIESLFVHPISYTVVLYTDHSSDALLSLLGHELTVQAGTKHLVATLTSSHAEEDFDDEGDPTTPRSRLLRASSTASQAVAQSLQNPISLSAAVPTSPMVDEEIQMARRLLFRKLCKTIGRAGRSTLMKGISHVATSSLRALRSLVRTDQLRRNQKALREGGAFEAVVDLLDALDVEKLEREEVSDLVAQVLETIVALFRGNRRARAYMNDVVGYKSVVQAISRCLTSSYEFDVDSFFDTFFAMVVEEDIFTPGASDVRIKNAGPLRMVIDLVRVIDREPIEKRIGILDQVVQLSVSSTPNRSAVASGNILDVVIDWLPEVFNCEQLALKIVSLARVIAEYSITAAQLSQVLAVVRNPQCKSNRIRCSLIKALENSLAPRDGPLAFFDFSGRKSGLVAGNSAPIIFHLSRGYAVSTWVRSETVGEADLFFIQDDKKTVSSVSLNRFGGLTARVSTAGAKHRDMGGPSTVNCDVRIPHGKWCHLVVSHAAPGTFSRTGDLEVYLNGRKVACGGLRYPRFSGSLELFCLGCCVISPSTQTANCFRGQLGAVYMIGDNVAHDTVTSLHALGPSYDGDLLPYGGTIQRAVAALALPPAALGAVEGGKLAERVRLLYAPRAADNRACPENSALGAAGTHPTTFARLVGPEGATQRCVATDARNSLSVLGGIRQILPILNQLDSLVGTTHDSLSAEFDVLDCCLRLLAAILRGDRMYQVAMSKCNGFGLLAFFLIRSSPKHLTIAVVDSVWQILDTVSEDPELARSFVNAIVFQLKIWRMAEPQVQQEFWSRLVRCWAPESRAELESPAGRTQELIRRSFSVCHASDEISYVPEDVRPLVYNTILSAIQVFDKEETETLRDNATQTFVGLLFTAVPQTSHERNNQILDEVLSLILEQFSVDNYAARSFRRALAAVGQSSVATMLCVFWSPSKTLQHKAIKCSLLLARQMKSQQTEDVTIATATAALIFSGADMAAHQLAINLAFGDQVTISEPFDAAIPIVFSLAAVDDDIFSKVSVIRGLESELLSSESSVARVLQHTTWPIWIVKILEDCDTRRTDDVRSAEALEEAASRLLHAMLSVVLKTTSQKDFQQNVNAITSVGSEVFQRRTLLTLLSIAQEKFVPFISLLSGRQDLRARDQTQRFSIIVTAAEAFLFSRQGVLDEEIAVMVLDTARLLGLWLVEKVAVSASGSNQGMSGDEIPLPDSSTSQDVSLESKDTGGLLRTSLRLLCGLVACVESQKRRSGFIEILCAAVAPPNGQVLSTIWLSYVKQKLEEHIAECSPKDDTQRVNDLIKAVALVESQWVKLKFKSKVKLDKELSNMEIAESTAAEIIELEQWTTDYVENMKREIAVIHEESTRRESDMLETAAKAREWALEVVRKRSESEENRLRADLSQFHTHQRERTAEWRLLRQDIEWEETSSKPQNGPEYWTLDTHCDSLNRRWLLRLNPEGSDHKEAALDNTGTTSGSFSAVDGEDRKDPVDEISGMLKQQPKKISSSLLPDEVETDDEEDGVRGYPELEEDLSVKPMEPSRESLIGKARQESSALFGTLSVFSPTSQPTAVLWASNCRLVNPLSVISGRLELSRSVVVFTSTEDPRSNDTQHGHWPSGKRPYFKDCVISLENIEEVHYRRYMLRPVALELFLTDKSTIFFALETESSSRTLLKMLETQLRRANNNAKVYRTARSCQSAARDVKEAWKKASISNFEYLMEINKLSGRSYNDISQYPVFPWILADYHSQELDFENPKTFRDLSKPMGCQPSPNESLPDNCISEREVYFRERYDSWSDPRGIPPFHYGSHYSSAGTVLHFLVRMEPFTSLFIQIQGGHFDYADRMFRSMKGAFESATSSTQNVNELTPEFFYNVDFLKNRNKLPLGVTQDQALIDDIELPPWAGSSPERFIRLHREALESPFVSSQLHGWVDLIFGNKQRGPPAVESCNVFYYLTYEKAIDLDSITDMALRKATESQIMHFGQTPMQLFSGRPHPSRERPATVSARSNSTKETSQKFRYLNFETENSLSGDPLIWIANVVDSIMTVARSRSLAVHRWHPFPDLQGNPFTFEPDIKLSGADMPGGHRRKGPGKGRRLGGAHVAPCLAETKLGQIFATTIDGRFVISGGHWDGTVRCSVISEPGRPKQILSYHRDVVTCLDLSGDGQILVTGSRDASVLLWDVVWRGGDKSPLVHPTMGNSFVSTHTLGGTATEGHGATTKVISNKPRMIFSGHIDPVTVVALNKDIGYVLSADEGGRVLLHSIRDGRLIRASIGRQVTRAIPTVLGEIVFYSEVDNLLWVEGVNGGKVAEKRLQVRISALTVSSDGRLVIAAFESNGVSVRTAWDLREVHHYSIPTSSVSALTLASDESNIFIGLRNGQLQALSLDREAFRRNARMEGLRGGLPGWYSS